jgi:iron complex outermembrane receptor protein
MVMLFQASAARAQHASDNPVTAAQDAYGLTLGLESVGIYSPFLVRGFSPQAAGNVRIDGIYFDQQGGLSNRVIDASTIRVGITEIGYAFPAPTGIVDYDLRRPGGDTPSATIIASVGPYNAWGISIDGSVPLIGDELVLPIGVSTEVSTGGPYGPYPDLTSRVTSIGATPQWSPSEKFTARLLIDWQHTSDARTFPLYFTAGDFLPPPITTQYRGQNWAKARNDTLNLGGFIDASLTDTWSLKAGAFRSMNDNPIGFADLYTGILPDRQSDHLVIGYPDQNTTSTSGEIRLTGTFTTDDWRHQFILMARGRDTTARYGGQDAVDLGPATIGVFLQAPQPDFAYTPRSIDHTTLWSVGSAYHAGWRNVGEFEAGAQLENYHAMVTNPGEPASEASAHPVRIYANSAVALAPQLTLYAGYTQGLEDSGVAPNTAKNSGAVLPASLTWQVDAGLRYALTPQFKIIAGVFELQKPYFNLDSNNVDRELGEQKAKGLELSIAGEPFPNFHLNVGILADRVGITGPDLAAEGVGPIAVGQPHFMYVMSANYSLPWWPALSLDISATHFGDQPESVDNSIYTQATTQVNVGGRYKFAAFGTSNSLRVQVQNLQNGKGWTNVYTPGFFEFPGPRTVFVYLTTDVGH